MVRTSFAVMVGSIAAFLVAILAFLGGWTVARTTEGTPLQTFSAATVSEAPRDEIPPAYVDDSLGLVQDVRDIINREFYHTEPLDQQQMVYGAIRGMLASLNDDYTIFQEPEDAERSQESLQGHFEGIGVYIRTDDAGNILINRPMQGSPAMQAGLESDDVIVAVDGAAVAEFTADMADDQAMDEVAQRVRGPKGSTVMLTIRRPVTDETFDVEITRDEVPLISVYSQMMDDIAYIQITEFKATTTEELDTALRELLPQQPAGIILDVRNNPGGFLITAREVLGRFYEGTALYEEMSDGELAELQTYEAPADVQVFDLPVVVLLNAQSASASEIVAGALRDERVDTTLLGETSFGKGSVQNIHRLRDGSSVRITIAHWFTPHRTEIEEVGIVPDYTVPASQEAQYNVPCTELMQMMQGSEPCSDAQLAWGLRVLSTGETPPPLEAAPAGGEE